MQNSDTQTITVGAWSVHLGATGSMRDLLFLADEDFEIEVDGSIVKATNMRSGKATAKAFTGGTIIKVRFMLNHEHKSILQEIWNYHTGVSLSTSDGRQGGIQFSGAVGKVLTPKRLVAYCHHWDEAGNEYGADANNPLTLELYRAFSEEMLKWMFNTSDNSKHECVLEGQPDYSRAQNSPGYFGKGVSL